MFNVLLATCLMISLNIVLAELPICNQDDMEYRFTECDAFNHRWKIYVPKHDTNCNVQPQHLPIKRKCDVSCPAGNYYDLEKDICEKCQPGYYSVGDGIRYDQWSSLPADFRIENYDCTDPSAGWKANGDDLQAIPSSCLYKLVIPVEVIKSGEISLEYQNTFPPKTSYFFIQIKSECDSRQAGQNAIDELTRGIQFLPVTGDIVKSVTVKISPGKYKLVINNLGTKTDVPSGLFALKSIEIKGMSFSPNCQPCKPGYYSSGGSSVCTACPEGKYSPGSASQQCLDCPPGKYSNRGASECLPKPPCTNSDYVAVSSPCIQNKTKVHYEWLQPMICSDKVAESAALPAESQEKICSPCNPGQELNEKGVCQYCKERTYSDGSSACQLCPLNTEAKKSISYTRFEVFPSRITSGCIHIDSFNSSSGQFCKKQTWLAQGAYLQLAPDLSNEQFALLFINVSGFSNASIDGKIHGALKMSFTMTCDINDVCLMYLMKTSKSGDITTVRTFNTSGNLTVKESFTETDITTLNIAYRRHPKSGEPGSSLSTVKFTEITLLNTIEGGASECTTCVLGGSKSGCHVCAPGEVIVNDNSTNTKTCGKCPQNHILVDMFTCKPCAPGLVPSADLKECVSDCKFAAADGHMFDFTLLSGIQSYQASTTFDTMGMPYYIGIHFSVCSSSAAKEQTIKPVCSASHANNTHSPSVDNKYNTQEVRSLACRVTMISSGTPMAIQPTSIGDVLLSITYNDLRERSHLIKNGVDIKNDTVTVHYNYVSERPTDVCINGLNTTVTLLCDLNAKGNGSLTFPPKCVGGTCDGCHYSLVWTSLNACPICSEADYMTIYGECVSGKQTITHIPRRDCINKDKGLRSDERPCSLLTLPMKIGVAVAGCISLVLFTCVIFCWKRSKKMEYKYMKLVEGTQGKDGELPAAQTCGWSDEEEEEEMDNSKVAFKTKGDQLFGKIGSNGKSDGFEKMKLVGSSLPEI